MVGNEKADVSQSRNENDEGDLRAHRSNAPESTDRRNFWHSIYLLQKLIFIKTTDCLSLHPTFRDRHFWIYCLPGFQLLKSCRAKSSVGWPCKRNRAST